MVVVHDRDAQALGGGLKDQLARIVVIDRRRLELVEPGRLLPRVEAARQVGVDQEGLLAEPGDVGDRADFVGQRARGDRIHSVVVEPHRMQASVGLFAQDDRGVDAVAQLGLGVGHRIDVDVEQRILPAQFGQAREQALAAEQRGQSQPHPQDPAVVHLLADLVGQILEHRGDGIVERLARVVELHLLVGALEQLLADKQFELADPPGKGRRGKPQFARRGFGRAEPDHPHESFQGAQGWEAAHRHCVPLRRSNQVRTERGAAADPPCVRRPR